VRDSGEFEVESRIGQEAPAEIMMKARLVAEKASLQYRRDEASLEEFREAMNTLHRMTRTKWSGTSDVKPPNCLFERVGEGEDSEKVMKSFLDDLSSQELQTVLDRTGKMFEKLNLHGKMKENSIDQGMGGKSAAKKAKEKAGNQQ